MGMQKKEETKPVLAVPPVPSLPQTSVNPHPRNEASPVAPAQKAVVKAVEQRSERAGDDKILQVKTRDRSIEIQAILKSTLESPMLAQMTQGKDDKSTLETLKKVFEFSLSLYAETK